MIKDKTFKIKEKYFNAILRFEKPFELRHEKVEPNSIIKLECENGKSLIFRSGECELLVKNGYRYIHYNYKYNWQNIKYKDNIKYEFQEKECFHWLDPYGEWTTEFDWYDTFCWEYINQAPTYLIEIAKILEVK